MNADLRQNLKLGKRDGVSILWWILYSWILSESLPCGLPFILPSYYVLKFRSACLYQDLKACAALKHPVFSHLGRATQGNSGWGCTMHLRRTNIPNRRFSSRQSTPAAWPLFGFCHLFHLREFQGNSLLDLWCKKAKLMNAVVTIYTFMPPFCCPATELFSWSTKNAH